MITVNLKNKKIKLSRNLNVFNKEQVLFDLNFKDQGRFNLILILFIFVLFLFFLGAFYFKKEKNFSSFINGSSQTTPLITKVLPTDIPDSKYHKMVDSQKIFLEKFKKKYPLPVKEVVPDGLEDELFNIYHKAYLKLGYSPLKRGNFIISAFYGDSAEGEIRYSTEKNNTLNLGAFWTMNIIKGNWKVIFPLQRQYPVCNDLEKVIKDLKSWQGLCVSSSSAKLQDGLHPNESYNNY